MSNGAYSDIIKELGHVLDDLTVLGGLSLKQLLNHHHALCHHRLCRDIYIPNPLVLETLQLFTLPNSVYHLCWRAATPGR